MEKSLMAWNTNRDINMGDSELIIPARYNDTVRISQLSGANGACLTYARVNQPSRDLYSGIDEKGIAYIICPGEKETIEINVAQKMVVFDGVYGNGYIFKGWEAWNTDYADTAYLNIPAISDNVIGFTAKSKNCPLHHNIPSISMAQTVRNSAVPSVHRQPPTRCLPRNRLKKA